MGGIMKKLRGVILDSGLFRLGIGGPQLKNNSSVIEHRNSDDTGFVVARGATPVGVNDLATKLYVDQAERVLIIEGQIDGSSGTPANTGTVGAYVVTTSGAGGEPQVGEIWWSDGSGSGNMTNLGVLDSRTIATKASLSGGTVELDADSIYLWDATGTAWLKIGDIGSVVGAEREIRFVVGTTTVASATSIPANARITHVALEITTAYAVSGTLSVGITGTVAKYMATTEVDPQNADGDTFVKEQDTDHGGAAAAALVTVGGTPASGAAVCTVRFTNPLG